MFKKLCALALLFSVSAVMSMDPVVKKRRVEADDTPAVMNVDPVAESILRDTSYPEWLRGFTSFPEWLKVSNSDLCDAKLEKVSAEPVKMGPGAAKRLRELLP